MVCHLSVCRPSHSCISFITVQRVHTPLGRHACRIQWCTVRWRPWLPRVGKPKLALAYLRFNRGQHWSSISSYSRGCPCYQRTKSWFWWSRLFVVEPTAGRFGCRQKNVNNKPRHVDVCTQRQFVQLNGCKRLRIPLPHSSRIISDEKRRVGGLLQQQPTKKREPKFHYTDFATFIETSPRESRGHKSWKSATHNMSPTFVICVHDFPHKEVSVKVGIMEFGLKDNICARSQKKSVH